MKKEEREEDSGLHDIRNLAQSTKQRLSSRRVSTSPISDEDALASASGSWKNIALPQPAKMVSLPELADLPSKADLVAAEKAAKAAAVAAKEAAKEAKKTARESKKDIAVEAAPAAAVTAAAVEPVAATPAAATPAVERKSFALPSQQSKSSKGPLFALVGLGVAAAAGGVIYMQMGKKSEEPAPQVAAAPAQAEVTTTPIEPPAAAPTPPPPVEPAAGSAVEEPPPVAAIAAAPADKKDEDKEAKAKKSKVHTVEIVDEGKKAPDKPAPEKQKAPAPEKAAAGGGGEGEPSFDQLLKEAGVDETKKEKKPALDKKELSGDDFKKGMSAVAANAKACYAGNQGIAMMKLVISPEGKVSKVTITGAFAGKPEADCVSNAVKAATFPAWDGGPQSFNFSYMLAE